MAPVHLGFLLALLSSVTTAGAHALLKAGKDKLAVRALIGVTGAVAMLPVCFAVPPPTGAMLPWLAIACVLHTTYQLVLIRAYEATDFALAYPIARGVAPVSTAILGLALLGDRVSAAGLVGAGLVSGGLALIALGRRMALAGLLAAAIAGLLTTAYTLVDAHAVRLAPQALTFIAWFFVLDGLIILPIFIVVRRGRSRELMRAEGRQGVMSGLISLVSFGSALWALRLAPAGLVSALRETTVIFGMVIAACILRERVDWRRAAGAVVIAAGAILIIVANA